MLSLAFTFTSLDATYSLMTPKIALTELRAVIDDRIHLTRDGDMEFSALVMNQKVFHVQAPSSDISIGFFQIKNPSNFSSSVGKYQSQMTTTPGLEYEYLSGRVGPRENIRFTIKSPRGGLMRAELSYYDRLKSVRAFVLINETKQWGFQTYANASISGEYALKMTNIGAYSISIDQIVLFHMPGSDTTYINLKTETDPASSYAWASTSISGRQFRLDGQIGPGASILVWIYMLYR
jgi:hypothetical protein